MKKLLFALLITLYSCSNSITKEDLQHLNGYWEIELVESTDKKTKQYTVNTTVDYFSINNNLKGFRKKIKPNLIGKYTTNKLQDTISIIQSEYDFIIHTKTGISEYKDFIKEISKEKLVLENEAGIKYHYKRHQKFDLNE